MPRAGQRSELIVFERATMTTDDDGIESPAWATYVTRRAHVRFGSAQEKREAAQEAGTQTATFECVRSAALDAVSLRDRILYLGSAWDINEVAPLDRKTIRFTAARAA